MGVSYACMHMHAHTCTHARTCMLNMINMDASMSVAICNFYTCIHVHACVSVCAHAYECSSVNVLISSRDVIFSDNVVLFL